MHERIAEILDRAGGVEDAVTEVVDLFAALLEGSDFQSGCPIATVALEANAENRDVCSACSGAYESWLETLEERFASWGIDRPSAPELATTALSMLDGALSLARVRRDVSALRTRWRAVDPNARLRRNTVMFQNPDGNRSFRSSPGRSGSRVARGQQERRFPGGLMFVHHLNCGTLRPPGGRLVNGSGSLLGSARMVCHCLLVETEHGLVLVDTGIGTADVRSGSATLGRGWVTLIRPELSRAETAAAQVVRLGYRIEDVRHIVLTHLDLDHAGGLADFPRAKVHVHETEYLAAGRSGKVETARYRADHWKHGPDWAVHRSGGESWFGFEAVRDLPGLPPEILFIPLAGHSRGHAGVAVRTEQGWLLHAGDAFFSQRQLDPVRPSAPPLLRAFENVMQFDGRARRENQRQLRELVRSRGRELEVFSSHDPSEFDRRAEQRTAASS